AQTLSQVGGTITLSDGGGSVIIDDTDPTNELQTLSVSATGDTLYLSNGNWVIIPGISAANPQPPSYPTGSVFCASGPTAIVDVTSANGLVWMDRNLGAAQVATSLSDPNGIGDLYQWGRRSDGHQCRTSANTGTLSSIDQPAHGDFIIGGDDWRSPQNDNLWQGVNGINNPCPSGYRLPTATELDVEVSSWPIGPSAPGFNSLLILPMAEIRDGGGWISGPAPLFAGYWTSTVSGVWSDYLFFMHADVPSMSDDGPRQHGFSVRCIKN
ncbi:fibrobacter succinogenes major paralogous domain-containing protein, partial [Flavobacteriales bacterium]|nr:fibrobacter succinogenes major paralogous domain-containing protein [Flavobacteriales bacterium]